jgi:hypothetical protein
MDMALRFMAIAHVWSSGDIEYVNLLDNGSLTTVYMEGAYVPPWLRERVALLRLCDVNKDTKGESLGRKFTEHMLYVYLTYDEHKELNEIVKSEGVQNEEAK